MVDVAAPMGYTSRIGTNRRSLATTTMTATKTASGHKIVQSIGHDRMSLRVKNGKEFAALNISRGGISITWRGADMKPIAEKIHELFRATEKKGTAYGAAFDQIAAELAA